MKKRKVPKIEKKDITNKKRKCNITRLDRWREYMGKKSIKRTASITLASSHSQI